jgi:transketolase
MSSQPSQQSQFFAPITSAIRALAMDAVQKANSGHPGAPMGMADIAEVLWRSHLKHNPNNPKWADRDRFVLSNGHGSMLLYSLLHLSGYDLSIDDLKNFRQLHSRTPGHPEYGYAPSASKPPPARWVRASPTPWAWRSPRRPWPSSSTSRATTSSTTTPTPFMGDGCLMEGISHEACSLAGTLGLGKLIAFWDDNGISIDGHVEGWFTDDTPKRFEAYGWHVIPAVDGHMTRKPSTRHRSRQGRDRQADLICCRTIIGYGFPEQVRLPRLPRRTAGQRRDRRRPCLPEVGPRAVRHPVRHRRRVERSGEGRQARIRLGCQVRRL